MCQELEAWYLGDPSALAQAFEDDSLRSITKKARFRDPDAVVQPFAALVELAPAFQKVSGARAMAPCLAIDKNSSRSFNVFVKTIKDLAREAGD